MHITDLVAAVFVVTIIYVLVRPRSKAADFINAFSKALTVIVTNATDLASA